MDKRLHDKGIKEKLDFPRKTLFHSLSAKTIHDRRLRLEIFLNRLAELVDLNEIPEACEFLEIESHTHILLSSLDYEVQSETELWGSAPDPALTLKERCRGASEDLILSGGRKESERVEAFLHRLNDDTLSTAKAVKEFEAGYFGNSLELNSVEIKRLLWGDAAFKGLLYYCGDAQNPIGGGYCMELLAKLVKYEYNSVKADQFLAVFSTTEPALVRKMGLDHYVKEVRSHDSAGLLALYYYLRYNTHNISEPEELLEDKEAIAVYEKWLQNKVTCGIHLTRELCA